MPSTREQDQQRTAEQPWRKWYWTARWRKLSKHQLATEPLCRMCMAGGVVTAAAVCDHVEPHRGDERLFWRGPFQSLCTSCHSGLKQAAERGRRTQSLDDDGWPLPS